MAWKRKCYVDDEKDLRSPIPSQICSNEEFIPPAQSVQEKEVEYRLRQLADKNAKKLGLSRRRFLQTSAGMAATMLCFNEVFGKTYEVDPIEALDPAAFDEKWPKQEFIFDNQTHHVDVEPDWYKNSEDGRLAAGFISRLRPGFTDMAVAVEALNRLHYAKEMFFDSDSVMAIISGVPSSEWKDNILPPDKMVKTRNEINSWAGSQRMLSHGILRPNMGLSELDEMERQAKVLKVNSWKMYPGSLAGALKPYRLDDEKVAYPFWAKARKLGIKTACIHRGLPLGLFNEDNCHPGDVEKAAKDHPDINFVIYHSGWHPGARRKEGAAPDPQYIPWCSDLMALVKRNNLKNVYFETGSTWNGLSSARPEQAMHFFGQLLNMGMEDNIIWGTDSIWGGSPQSQIERFRRFQISDEIANKYGYKKLTPEIKAKVFGLNAARLYKLDVKAKRQAIKNDQIDKLRAEYKDNPQPSNTQYGWVWV
jgi:predicted TIM-barrel fold metal-dependent hydrolase